MNLGTVRRAGGRLAVADAALPRGVAREGGLFPELDCVRHLLATNALAAAERRAARTGVGADRALITSGAFDEESYLRALGVSLGIPFEPLDHTPRAQCPLDDSRLIACARIGLLPLRFGDQTVVVIAPRSTAARSLARLVKQYPAWASRFRFTSAQRLTRFILRGTGQTLVASASDGLKRKWPELSAAPVHRNGLASPPVVGIAIALCAFLGTPASAVFAVEVTLATMFIAWLGLRLAAAVFAVASSEHPTAQRDDTLPVYTVIAALYQEAASVDGLLRAIERFDYPVEKLDVILAVEADDLETHAAIRARRTCLPLTVIAVPTGGPRTKPKALNVALPFARGTFTVVYDAEDRPEANQLRQALQAFRNSDGKLACVQARLSIDNTDDGWLARQFTAEYASHFDVFLPAVAAMRLPLPLGGSSNHFYTDVLRAVGGWDAYNVTEDADLGMRVARFGYLCTMIASTTYEEAPARLRPWVRQRTRWFKGWMQTWLVHMRAPRRLWRELGAAGFITFQLAVGGNVLAALVHPVFMVGLIYSLASGFPIWRGDGATTVLLASLYGGSVVGGYFTSAFLGWLGLYRRGLLDAAWVLVATPVHWMLLSLAAWRALYQLVLAPYVWEKTEHGLARNSRRGASTVQMLAKLERHLTQLKASAGYRCRPD